MPSLYRPDPARFQASRDPERCAVAVYSGRSPIAHQCGNKGKYPHTFDHHIDGKVELLLCGNHKNVEDRYAEQKRQYQRDRNEAQKAREQAALDKARGEALIAQASLGRYVPAFGTVLTPSIVVELDEYEALLEHLQERDDV